jgi:hypothetical protein
MDVNLFNNLVPDFQLEYERVREQWFVLSAQTDLLNEMIIDCYDNNNFDSETVMFIERKREIKRQQREKFYDVQKYLGSLKDGIPFNVKRTVWRTMNRFGLTSEQAGMFLSIHRSHMKAMGEENQKKYALPNVRKVVWDEKDDCLKVYYEDTWWHYDRRGTWY